MKHDGSQHHWAIGHSADRAGYAEQTRVAEREDEILLARVGKSEGRGQVKDLRLQNTCFWLLADLIDWGQGPEVSARTTG